VLRPNMKKRVSCNRFTLLHDRDRGGNQHTYVPARTSRRVADVMPSFVAQWSAARFTRTPAPVLYRHVL